MVTIFSPDLASRSVSDFASRGSLSHFHVQFQELDGLGSSSGAATIDENKEWILGGSIRKWQTERFIETEAVCGQSGA